jgi:hypothetical protein
MTKARLDGLTMLILGALMFPLLGWVLQRAAPEKLVDLRMMYFPARCLMQHCDPYNESDVLRLYQREEGVRPEDTPKVLQVVTRYEYLPSAFAFTVPFAMLPWQPAQVLWLTLTVGSFIFSSLLIWDCGGKNAPVVSGLLIGFMLANSELLVITGTVAGLVLALCIAAVWCFVNERFALAGIVCLAFSLAIKPQDTGLIWLYFLLAGGIYRKRAMQTLVAVIVMSLPAALWVGGVSPHWIQELHTNVISFTAHGALNDPGPASTGAHGIAMVISLQAAFSFFRDDPHFYNLTTYLVCVPLIGLWAIITVRTRPSPAKTWLALASMSALSMLPVYHRQYDAKLLLLTIPAFTMLWARGGKIKWIALAVNAAAFVVTGDIPWAILFGVLKSLHLSETGTPNQIATAVQILPVPLTLLATGIFYLWIYARYCSDKKTLQANPAGPES